jgi:hypothetical protein
MRYVRQLRSLGLHLLDRAARKLRRSGVCEPLEQPVWASRTSFAEIAQRFPAGSRERSFAIRAEMMRRLHPNWRDLSAAEMADGIAALGNVQNHDSRLPQVTIVFSYMSNKSPVARARAMGVPV